LPIDFDQRAAKAFFDEIKRKREFVPGAPKLTWWVMDEIETVYKKSRPLLFSRCPPIAVKRGRMMMSPPRQPPSPPLV
jgi:hypothetical protein